MMATGEAPNVQRLDKSARESGLRYRDLDNMDYIMSTERLDSDWEHVSNELGFSNSNLSKIDHGTGRPKRDYQRLLQRTISRVSKK